jgi:hypothetical protein
VKEKEASIREKQSIEEKVFCDYSPLAGNVIYDLYFRIKGVSSRHEFKLKAGSVMKQNRKTPLRQRRLQRPIDALHRLILV